MGTAGVEGTDRGASSLVGLGSVGLLRVRKKPLSDCWPLVGLDPATGLLDLDRLRVFPGEAEAEARLFSGEFRGVTRGALSPFAVDVGGASALFASVVAVDEGSAIMALDGAVPSLSVDRVVEADLDSAGFLLNMSRMFLRFVNSGSRFPLNAGMSLDGSYSRNRTPPWNMPVGFIESRMCFSSSGCSASAATS